MRRIAYRSCPLCEACCGLEIECDGERVLAVRGDRRDPFSRGYLCAKGAALGRLHHDPDRLRSPLVRDAQGRLRPASWDEAIGHAADRLATIIARDGRDAVGHLVGNPVVHDVGALLASELYRALLGGRNRFTANSQDANPHLLASHLMFGRQIVQPVPDLERCRHLVLIGANPLVSNGSLLTAPGIGNRLRALRRRGGRLIVIDPRRTETAHIASEHLRIRPGSDAALLLAIAHTLLDEERHDARFVRRYCRDLPALRRALAPFSPARVAPWTGPDLSAERIRRLARELVEQRGVVYGRLGLCLNRFAGLAAWALHLVNVLAGALDRPGRALLPEGPWGALFRLPWTRGSYDTFRSPQGAPEINGEYPCRILAEQIERGIADPRAPEAMKGLVVLSGNPVRSAPDGRRIARALDRLEALVVFDVYRSETASRAHVVLPPAGPLHRPHFDPVFAQFALQRFARWSEPVLPPPADQPTEYALVLRLVREVVRRLPVRGPRELLRRAAAASLCRLRLETVLDALTRVGSLGTPYRGLTLARLRRHRHGLPTARPRTGVLRRRIGHRDGRIRLLPEPYRRDLGRLETALEAMRREDGTARAGAHTFRLITRRRLTTNNTWWHRVPNPRASARRAPLGIHPDDATRCGIAPGQWVTVRSARGALRVRAAFDSDLQPGLVCLPFGARAETGRDMLPCNDLTDDALYCPITGNAALNDVTVTLEPLAPSRPAGLEASGSAGACTGIAP